MKPDCTIIIRAFNEEKHIGKLYEGIFQQNLKNLQVILVDSGSSDHTVDITKEFPVEIIHIPPKEFTFGHSINKGMESARAEKVVFASAHVYPVYPDWLERLLEPFSDERVALSYGKQRGMPETRFSEQMIFSHWFPDQSNFNQNHPFCNNANAAIRRQLWEKHPYNETLPGLEDLEWSRWAMEQSYRIAYVAEAEIVHIHNETWYGIRNRYQREGMAFHLIYPQEKFGIFNFWHALVTNVISDWKIAEKQKKLKKVWREIVAFRWNQFLGTYRGYNQSGPLTWQLKQTFYYPRWNGENGTDRRMVDPIQYNGKSEKGL